MKKRFEEVYDHIWQRIERGEWKGHDKLPSVRTLALELNVHRLTVFKAYQLLKQNGKVYVVDKSGYYVQPDGARPSDRPAADAQAPIVASYVRQSRLSAIHRIPAVYQLSSALIDPNLLPNLYFSEYVKKVFDLYPKVLGTYAPVQGDEELREALARYFSGKFKIHLGGDDLLITSGAQQAIDLAARIFVGPLDAVLIERPTYSAAIDVFRQLGARLIPVDIHPAGYDLEAVEKAMRQFKPRLFYMNPTFHNPTGYTVPAEQRKRLVELAERHRCLLVEDDSFHDMYFEREPPQPLYTYDTEGCVLFIRGFSKFVAPGLRIAAVACRPALMKQLVTAKSLADNGTPLLNQKIFLHYFTSERLQQHLAKLRIALSVRCDIMEEELSATDWSWRRPEGGLNLWVKLPPSVSPEALLSRSVKQSLSFVPGAICDPAGGSTSRIRLSYSYVSEHLLRDGVRLLVRLAREM